MAVSSADVRAIHAFTCVHKIVRHASPVQASHDSQLQSNTIHTKHVHTSYATDSVNGACACDGLQHKTLQHGGQLLRC